SEPLRAAPEPPRRRRRLFLEDPVMMHRLTTACLAACALALLAAAAPAAADDCVTFSSLGHCPVGDATLALVDGELQVSNLGSGARDGVAVTLPDVRNWEAGVHHASGTSAPHVRLGALAGGEEISTAEVVTSGSDLHLSATFTGSDGPGTYSVLAYQKGTLVGSQGGVGSDGFLTFIQDEDLFMFLIGFYGFYDRTSNGACVWTFGFSKPLPVGMPDGTWLEGDRIELVEEVG